MGDYNKNEIEFCPFCGGESFNQRTTDSIDYTICEYDIICRECGKIVNRWGYGWFENYHHNSPEYRKMLRKKKLKNIEK